MTIAIKCWGRDGGADIPDEVERQPGESRIEALIRAIEEANPGYAVVTCRRDGWEQERDGRAVREAYQMSLSNQVNRFGAALAGEIWVSIRVDDGILGPRALSLLSRHRVATLPHGEEA